MADRLTRQFEDSRPRLQAIARRMLGSATEAEDAVQEVWLRLNRTGGEDIDNLSGWLTTVVSRVCLDMLRSRRSRPEDSVGGGVSEVVAGVADVEKPEHEVLVADAIGPALVLVLDSLEPHERLAFVLHDLFGVPFAEVAPIVGRSPAAARQLASRARRKLQGQVASESGPPKQPHPQQTQLVEAFLAASRRGDFTALFALLDPEVVLRADPVAVRSATARRARGAPVLSDEIRGQDAVARVFAGRAAAAEPALIDGNPGAVVWAPNGRPLAVFILRWHKGLISEIELVADARRLRALEILT